jgi:galactose oxidase-like protein
MGGQLCTLGDILVGRWRFERLGPWRVCALASVALGLNAAAPAVGQGEPAARLAGKTQWAGTVAAARRVDNLLVNPDVTARRAGVPTCYSEASLTGATVRFSEPPRGSGGAIVLRLGSSRQQRMVTQSPACAPRVAVGHSYSASLSYSGTGAALSLEVLEHVHGAWRVSHVAEHLKARRVFTTASVLVGPIQAGVNRLAFGVLLRGRGAIRTTGYSLSDVSAHPLAPVTTSQPATGGDATTPAPTTTSPTKPATVIPSEGLPAPTEKPSEGLPPPIEKLPSQCEELAREELPLELSLPEGPSTEPLSVTGRWTVREGVDHARTVHAVLLQNGKLLLMAGSGNSRMEFDAGCFRSYVYNPVANTWREIPTPTDLFCAGHVQLANGNVLILGGTKAYPAPPKPGEYPSTVYEGENASWIFNIQTETYEKVPYDKLAPHQPKEPGPLLNGAWYPSATELGDGNAISFGGLNEQGNGATATNYYIAPYNPGDAAGDPSGQWVGFGSNELQQTYDWFWGLYPSMILTADGRLFYDGSHVFGNGLQGDNPTPAPDASALYDFYCTPGKSQKEEEHEQNDTNPEAAVVGPRVAGGPASEDETHPRVENTPGLEDPNQRDQSASLLLPPAQSQKVMVLGGGNTYETGAFATASTDEIDLLEPDPQWKKGPELPQGRLDDGELEPTGAGKMYVSAVALPNGTVLETGGSLLPRTKDVHEASVFDPASNEFTPVASDPVGRDYHSEALLLPNGDVMALGSNPVNVGTGTEGFQTAISIYEPPYMFQGERPVLESVDGQVNRLQDNVNYTAQWAYGSEHTLAYTSKSSEIASAVLIRPAAVTHSSDPNQREVALPIEGLSGPRGAGRSLEVGLTANPNLAPPGYYMVFLVNAAGVPSEAQWVHVGPQGAPTP